MGDYNNGGHCTDCGGDNGIHYSGCTYEGVGEEQNFRGSGSGFSFFKLTISMPIGFILTILLLSDLGIGDCGSILFLIIYVLITYIVGCVIYKL